MNAKGIFPLILAASLLLFALPVSAQEPAQDITAGCTILSQAGSENPDLLDHNPATVFRANKGDTIVVQSSAPIYQLYLVWEQGPTRWELITKDALPVTNSSHSFLKEYTALQAPQNELTIRFLAKENALCDIYAFGEGEVPSFVQKWQPPCETADLLIFPTHCQDELLCFGGTIPLYTSKKNMNVQVAYLALDTKQPAELHLALDNLWQAGMTAYPVFSGIQKQETESDDARIQYNEDDLISFETEQIRRFKPKVVLGNELTGEAGNSVRALGAETLLAALESSTNEMEFRDSAKKYGTWNTPKTYLHRFHENPLYLDWKLPLESFNNETALGVAINILQGNGMDIALTDFDSAFGLVRTTVGEDVTGNDLFENIALSEEIAPVEEESSPQAVKPVPAPENNRRLLYSLGIASLLCTLAAFLLTLKKEVY